MEQLILHLFGDYVTQSDWMALNKRKSTPAALCHAFVYSLPFLLLTYGHGQFCWMTILWTHFLIDRYGLARYVVWAKNFNWFRKSRMQTLGEAVTEARERGEIGNVIGPDDAWPIPCERPFEWTWKECSATGYDPTRPAWLAVWLMIAADNTLHLAINYAALRWL
jgi:hypothetical protein